MKDLSIVIPCYKEKESIVERIYDDLVALDAEVIVVDDGGFMAFSERIRTVSYNGNKGYGYAIKKGVEAASRPFIITIDGDGQHSVKDAEKLYKVFSMIDDCKMLVGCRWNLKEEQHRTFGRKILNFIATCFAGHYLIDLNSGMRMFSRDLAIKYEKILCDRFSYTTSLTLSFIADGYKVAWFPIDVVPRKYGKSRVNVIKDGFVTLYYILRIGIACRTRGIRGWLRNILGQ